MQSKNKSFADFGKPGFSINSLDVIVVTKIFFV
jgi:hypothetical protein